MNYNSIKFENILKLTEYDMLSIYGKKYNFHLRSNVSFTDEKYFVGVIIDTLLYDEKNIVKRPAVVKLVIQNETKTEIEFNLLHLHEMILIEQ